MNGEMMVLYGLMKSKHLYLLEEYRIIFTG